MDIEIAIGIRILAGSYLSTDLATCGMTGASPAPRALWAKKPA